jgi:hypothetical protein
MPEQEQRFPNKDTSLAEAVPASAREHVRQRLTNADLLATIDSRLVDRYAPKRRERLAPLSMEGKPFGQVVVEEREK